MTKTVKASASGSEAEIMIYGEIVSDLWKWAESDVTALDFDKAIKEAKGAEKLVLRINSPGGDCFQAAAMRTMLMNANIPNLEIRIEGLCASAATMLACVPGATVCMGDGSMYMIHAPWMITWGCANDLQQSVDMLRKMEADDRAIYMKRSGQDEARIKEWVDAETWFTAKEAVEYGFADEIMEGARAAASANAMTLMRGMYRNVPEALEEEPQESAEETIQGSDGAEAGPADVPAEINGDEGEESGMDIKDMTIEQLRQENPELFMSIANAGSEAERTRMQEIDDLTPQGMEPLGAQAKADGTSAADYLKMVVKAQREKGEQFLVNRKAETAPAQEIAGGGIEEQSMDEMKRNAQEIADYAKAARNQTNTTMY